MALNHDEAKLVVRVDQNSDSDLQALFDSVLKPDSKRPLQVPLRMRKLPDSFFNPPSTGSKSSSVSHSHENSADSAFGSGVVNKIVANNTTLLSPAPPAPLIISHSRAHSSPATLQQTYAISTGTQNSTPAPTHIKQRSYDTVGTVVENNLGPLPPGWEQATTSEGLVYYINHLTQTTTWEDPRKNLVAMRHTSAEQLITRKLPPQVPAVVVADKFDSKGSPDPLGSLPDGYEQAQTAEGEIYFINHHTKTTTWFDPRIPIQLQRNPGLNAMLPQLLLTSNNASQSPQEQQQQKLRLQSLKREREMLKQRQQEIARHQELIDPFLSGLTQQHARTESADSGLGTSYSLPQTPEDFLANLDDNKMDCVSESAASSINASSVLSAVNEVIDSTDDLVPSLQLGEDFSSDILVDMESFINADSKTDNVLTWL